MPPFGFRLGIAVLLGVAIVAGAPAAAEEPPYRLELDASGAEGGAGWAGGALAFYLDSFLGEAASLEGTVPFTPFSVEARLSTEGDDLVYRLRLETGDGQIAESELRGDPATSALWLSEVALVVQLTVFPDAAGGPPWTGPTTSTEALRHFLAAAGAEGIGEKERLLRKALTNL